MKCSNSMPGLPTFQNLFRYSEYPYPKLWKFYGHENVIAIFLLGSHNFIQGFQYFQFHPFSFGWVCLIKQKINFLSLFKITF